MSGCPGGVWTNSSYQHWPPHWLYVAKPGSAGLALVRSVNAGVPVATSSLRNSREYGVPVLPS